MLAVLEALLHMDRPYGLELIQRTGLPSGTVYPLLARLEDAGLVSSAWEAEEPIQGRPRRRLYTISAEGIEFARDALAEGRPVARPAARPAAVPTPVSLPRPGTSGGVS
ncbi:PadR family transcriptional regulator [Streptomyces lunaelactis]|nr:PadR family transcriptional regulator [Streptomyces lunaelactis]NUK09405.1 PadR family transcriptional regulator [Streptomyces lunaelactis]NUK36041.1 PadR family transcriptional regulator [Streptomyces lunaelactis]NUK44274.1 PadR family transcriptional regulator [Streptomyces lunaelactis]NUK58353.1 PadR family transcriptional regulator [Streptomyces lunaelactis]NUK94947.1 PadR family transcriptional regulator [Streptomyces lunaelactis]